MQDWMLNTVIGVALLSALVGLPTSVLANLISPSVSRWFGARLGRAGASQPMRRAEQPGPLREGSHSPGPPRVVRRSPPLLYLWSLTSLSGIALITAVSTDRIHGGAVIMAIVLLGVLGLMLGALLPLATWYRAVPWLFMATLVSLAALIVFGRPLEGAWGISSFSLPGLGAVRPVEFLKVVFILFMARFLTRRERQMTTRDLVPLVAVLGMLEAVVYRGLDLGSALVILGIAAGMLVAFGTHWRTVGLVTAASLVLLASTSAWLAYQPGRLAAPENPLRQESADQVSQFWSAVHKVGLFGAGLGRSELALQDSQTEGEAGATLAVLVEELGLLRLCALLMLLGTLVWWGYQVAGRAPDRFGGLAASGFTTWVMVQSYVSIAAATGTISLVPVPLPYVSPDSSLFAALMVGAGIVIQVSRKQILPPRERHI